MPWVSPPTFTDGSVLTGAQLNVLRDDLNETAAAKATTAGQLFVATGANALAARTPTSAVISTSQATGSTSYTDLGTIGPQVASLTTGTRALCFWAAHTFNNTAGSTCFAAVAVSSATTLAAADAAALRYQAFGANGRHRGAGMTMITGLNAGSNTFTVQYRVDGNTGTWLERELVVLPL